MGQDQCRETKVDKCDLAQVQTSFNDCMNKCMDGLVANEGWYCEAACSDLKYEDSALAQTSALLRG